MCVKKFCQKYALNIIYIILKISKGGDRVFYVLDICNASVTCKCLAFKLLGDIF